MFDVKTYKTDGSEGATVRGLTWVQMTSLQSVLAQHGVKYFTKQVSGLTPDAPELATPSTSCPECEKYHHFYHALPTSTPIR
jgi:hypothetical protein